MAPLRNTVRFVHRQQGRWVAAELIEETVHHQPLGGDIQHFDLAAAATRHHLELLLTRLR
ncbi:hypothetical protein D3C73_1271000 [compost metagenome]